MVSVTGSSSVSLPVYLCAELRVSLLSCWLSRRDRLDLVSVCRPPTFCLSVRSPIAPGALPILPDRAAFALLVVDVDVAPPSRVLPLSTPRPMVWFEDVATRSSSSETSGAISYAWCDMLLPAADSPKRAARWRAVVIT